MRKSRKVNSIYWCLKSFRIRLKFPVDWVKEGLDVPYLQYEAIHYVLSILGNFNRPFKVYLEVNCVVRD